MRGRHSAVLALLATVGMTVGGCAAATGGQAESRFPTIFAGEPPGGGPLGVYSSETGHRLRTLGAGAIAAEVVDHGRWTYFLTSPSPCRFAIKRVRTGGGPTIAVRTSLVGTLGFGVSRDGRMLAYQTVAGSVASCDQHGGTGQLLTVANLETGVTRAIPLPAAVAGVNSIAWAPNDLSVTIATGAAGGDGPLTLTMANVMTDRTWSVQDSTPCPGRDTCYILAVGYGAKGHLFFIANDSSAADGEYRLMRASSDGRALQLASWNGRASSGGWESIDAAGTAAIVVIPGRGGGWRTILWTKTAERDLPLKLVAASWS